MSNIRSQDRYYLTLIFVVSSLAGWLLYYSRVEVELTIGGTLILAFVSAVNYYFNRNLIFLKSRIKRIRKDVVFNDRVELALIQIHYGRYSKGLNKLKSEKKCDEKVAELISEVELFLKKK